MREAAEKKGHKKEKKAKKAKKAKHDSGSDASRSPSPRCVLRGTCNAI